MLPCTDETSEPSGVAVDLTDDMVSVRIGADLIDLSELQLCRKRSAPVSKTHRRPQENVMFNMCFGLYHTAFIQLHHDGQIGY